MADDIEELCLVEVALLLFEINASVQIIRVNYCLYLVRFISPLAANSSANSCL